MEIMVAMAIVGVIFAAAATGLRSAFNVNLKSSAGKLASTLRYLSNKAVTEHRYIRVIYDLQAQSYSVEECTDPVVISVEDEEDQAKEDEKENAAGFVPSEPDERVRPFLALRKKTLTALMCIRKGADYLHLLDVIEDEKEVQWHLQFPLQDDSDMFEVVSGGTVAA